jgi:hypothetical protein
MGWISNRMMRNRTKWGAPISDEKRRAPLRLIVGILRHRDGMFDTDRVVLECGHEAEAWGTSKARCVGCLPEAPFDS